MGQRKTGQGAKPRPVKITVKPGAKPSILNNARNLKKSEFSKVGISRDRTKSELAEFYKKRAEFTKRLEDGEDVVWVRGETVLRSSLTRPSGSSNDKAGSGTSTDKSEN